GAETGVRHGAERDAALHAPGGNVEDVQRRVELRDDEEPAPAFVDREPGRPDRAGTVIDLLSLRVLATLGPAWTDDDRVHQRRAPARARVEETAVRAAGGHGEHPPLVEKGDAEPRLVERNPLQVLARHEVDEIEPLALPAAVRHGREALVGADRKS